MVNVKGGFLRELRQSTVLAQLVGSLPYTTHQLALTILVDY